MKHGIIAFLTASFACSNSLCYAGTQIDFDSSAAIGAGTIQSISEGASLPIPANPSPADIFHTPSQSELGNTVFGITFHGTTQQEIFKDVLIQYLIKSGAGRACAVGVISRSDTYVVLRNGVIDIVSNNTGEQLYSVNNPALVNTMRIISAKVFVKENKVAPILICEFVEVVVMELVWKAIEGSWTQVWVETKKMVKECKESAGPIDEPAYTDTGTNGWPIPVRTFYPEVL